MEGLAVVSRIAKRNPLAVGRKGGSPRESCDAQRSRNRCTTQHALLLFGLLRDVSRFRRDGAMIPPADER